MGTTDKATGRLKKAAGDLSGDASLRREGEKEERKADAKEELKHAQDQVENRAVKVDELDREGRPPGERRP
jgi:uncharacterized protein YjbJ (UPF0337 family)